MPLSATHSRHVWLVRLCTLTAFVVSLGWASSAFAVAPMCGPRAQSIAAPPNGTATNGDTLSATPCRDAGPLFATGTTPQNAPEKLSVSELPIRALPILTRLAACPVTGRLSSALPEHELLATGFARTIDRPPRS